jgi:hypothetical protein
MKNKLRVSNTAAFSIYNYIVCNNANLLLAEALEPAGDHGTILALSLASNSSGHLGVLAKASLEFWGLKSGCPLSVFDSKLTIRICLTGHLLCAWDAISSHGHDPLAKGICGAFLNAKRY